MQRSERAIITITIAIIVILAGAGCGAPREEVIRTLSAQPPAALVSQVSSGVPTVGAPRPREEGRRSHLTLFLTPTTFLRHLRPPTADDQYVQGCLLDIAARKACVPTPGNRGRIRQFLAAAFELGADTISYGFHWLEVQPDVLKPADYTIVKEAIDEILADGRFKVIVNVGLGVYDFRGLKQGLLPANVEIEPSGDMDPAPYATLALPPPTAGARPTFETHTYAVSLHSQFARANMLSFVRQAAARVASFEANARRGGRAEIIAFGTAWGYTGGEDLGLVQGLGDYHPRARADFQRYLRGIYGSPERLGRAWGTSSPLEFDRLDVWLPGETVASQRYLDWVQFQNHTFNTRYATPVRAAIRRANSRWKYLWWTLDPFFHIDRYQIPGMKSRGSHPAWRGSQMYLAHRTIAAAEVGIVGACANPGAAVFRAHAPRVERYCDLGALLADSFRACKVVFDRKQRRFTFDSKCWDKRMVPLTRAADEMIAQAIDYPEMMYVDSGFGWTLLRDPLLRKRYLGFLYAWGRRAKEVLPLPVEPAPTITVSLRSLYGDAEKPAPQRKALSALMGLFWKQVNAHGGWPSAQVLIRFKDDLASPDVQP